MDGEERISIDARGEDGAKVEYRVWNPFRSKLTAGVLGQDLHCAWPEGVAPWCSGPGGCADIVCLFVERGLTLVN